MAKGGWPGNGGRIRPSLLALAAGLLILGAVVSQAEAIPALCDGTVQTECMLGDSGWTVTIPPNVRITFLGLDRPTARREDIHFLKEYDVFDFGPVTLRFNPFDPPRIVDSFFRMDEVVTNKMLVPFNAFQFTTRDEDNDPCSTFHPGIAHIHPDGTAAPSPNFGGATQWDGLLPVKGRCPGAGKENDGTNFLLVQGRMIAPNDMWKPERIRLHQIDGGTWFLTQQVAPEPATLVLFASGGLVLVVGYLRSRRRQAS
jgi:hypothetical protein